MNKTKMMNARIGERANLFMKNAEDRELTPEEIERTAKKRGEISEWIQKQDWYNRKRI